jgi:hypothetical protein
MNFFRGALKLFGRWAVGVACLGTITLGTTITASSQDFPPGDVISARKTLMSVIAKKACDTCHAAFQKNN